MTSQLKSSLVNRLYPPHERWKPLRGPSEEEAPVSETGSLPFKPLDVRDLNQFIAIANGKRMESTLEPLFNGVKNLASTDPKDKNAELMQKAFLDIVLLEQRSPQPSEDPLTIGNGSATTEGRHPYTRLTNNKNINTPPPAEKVFEDLLLRRPPTQAGAQASGHPNGISGIAFALITIIYLSVSRESSADHSYSETSPYLDLFPLYGGADSGIRRNSDGLIKPDCFCEDRVEFLTPSVVTLLILFNRNHNYIARRLAADKTRSPEDREDLKLFGHAKTINCIHFKDIIVNDLLKGLMGHDFFEHGPNFDFLRDANLKARNLSPLDRCSVEVALLCFSPSLLCHQDLEWLHQADLDALRQEREDARRNKTPDQAFDTTTYERGNDSRVKDESLARLLMQVLESEGGTHGANTVEEKWKAHTIAAIDRYRGWKTCTINEFRKFLGLEAYTNFYDWNNDSAVMQVVKVIYGTIENLELLPGLLAEQSKTDKTGLGLGYTQTYGLVRAIITSVCCDARFTTDFNETTLTKMGYEMCLSACDSESYGVALPSLIIRNLPYHFAYNSSRANFPLVVHKIVNIKLSEADKLRYGIVDLVKTHIVKDWTGIRRVLNEPENFTTPYGPALKLLTDGYGFMLGFDEKGLHGADQQMLMYSLMPDARTFRTYTKFIGATAKKLVKAMSKTESDGHCTIDLAHDVINPLCTLWVLETLCGEDVPINNEASRVKVLAEYLDDFASLFAFVFHRCEPAEIWACRSRAIATSKRINLALRQRIEDALPNPDEKTQGWFMEILNYIIRGRLFRDYIIPHAVRLSKEFTTGASLSKLSYSFIERLARTHSTIGKLPENVKLPDDIQKVIRAVNEGTRKAAETSQGGPQSVEHPNFETKFKEAEQKIQKALTGNTIKRLSANVLGLSVIMTVNYASVCTQIIDFYLRPEQRAHMEDIIELVNLKMPKSGHLRQWIAKVKTDVTQPFGPFPENLQDEKSVSQPEIPTKLQEFLLMGYVREAQRLSIPLSLIRQVVNDDREFKKGDRIIVDFGDLHNKSEDFFSESTSINPIREIYLYHGTGPCSRWSCTFGNEVCTTHPSEHTSPHPPPPPKCSKTDAELCPLYSKMKCPMIDGNGQPLETCPNHKAGCEALDLDPNHCGYHPDAPCGLPKNIGTECTVHAQGHLICKLHGFRSWSIQGLGVHKCPGLSFCDNTMPELLKAIFSLEDLKYQTNYNGITSQQFRPFAEQNLADVSTEPMLFTNDQGKVAPYPLSLKVSFRKRQEAQGFEDDRDDRKLPRWLVAVDLMIIVLSTLFSLSGSWSAETPPSVPITNDKPTISPAFKSVPTPYVANVTCKAPVTIFRRWEIGTILPDAYGQPSPLEYILERTTPHRLSLLDVDQRDMQLGVYVDGRDFGKTSEFVLDKGVWCYPMTPEGRDRCFAQGFSHGSFVIPAGKHTVRVVWVGKEHRPGSTTLDWGTERTRRLMWQFENCS